MRLITADFLPLLAHFGADNVVAIDFTLYADVAQLVARNLAKVQVAGSTPVVRSKFLSARSDGREARLGTANPATRVQIPFRPPRKSNKSKHREWI